MKAIRSELFKVLMVILLASTAEYVHPQDLSAHRWENRIVIVYTADSDSPLYHRQIDSLLLDPDGLDERKLVVYSMTPASFATGRDPEEWAPRTASLDRILDTERDFAVALIGLDGGVKMTRYEPVSREELYARIDSMPMRQNELRNRD